MRDLERFVLAQKDSYGIALKEIKSGHKQSCWMWYIFPQIKGLGMSSTAQYYAIENREEAIAYLSHPLLGRRLIEISEALLEIESDDALNLMGFPDHLKLQSSMTLFALVSDHPVFQAVLDKFFDGKMDDLTLQMLNR